MSQSKIKIKTILASFNEIVSMRTKIPITYLDFVHNGDIFHADQLYTGLIDDLKTEDFTDIEPDTEISTSLEGRRVLLELHIIVKDIGAEHGGLVQLMKSRSSEFSNHILGMLMNHVGDEYKLTILVNYIVKEVDKVLQTNEGWFDKNKVQVKEIIDVFNQLLHR